jgi:hypothetical protein
MDTQFEHIGIPFDQVIILSIAEGCMDARMSTYEHDNPSLGVICAFLEHLIAELTPITLGLVNFIHRNGMDSPTITFQVGVASIIHDFSMASTMHEFLEFVRHLPVDPEPRQRMLEASSDGVERARLERLMSLRMTDEQLSFIESSHRAILSFRAMSTYIADHFN